MYQQVHCIIPRVDCYYIKYCLYETVYVGKTPQRRDFVYPRDLAQSRPDSELLRDFQPAVSLPPLPESESEEEEVKQS